MNECKPSRYSDQRGRPSSLVSLYCRYGGYFDPQTKPESDSADVQADLSIRVAHVTSLDLLRRGSCDVAFFLFFFVDFAYHNYRNLR